MKKLNAAQSATLECGVRWSINILTEIAGNYAKMLSPYRREKIALAISALHCVIGPDPKG